MIPYGWKARIEYDGRFLTNRLYLFRRADDGTGEVIVGFDQQGDAITDTLEPGMMATFPGFTLDDYLLDALREAIAPGPSKAELQAYRDALDIERRRVDEILQRVTPIT